MIEKKYAFQKVLDLAGKLREKYKTAYYTNYPEDYWMFIAKKFDLKPYFDFGIVSYQFKTRKPEPKGFKIILKHFNVKPEEAVFIDDKEKNVKAAAELDINTIHLTNRKKIVDKLKLIGVKV